MQVPPLRRRNGGSGRDDTPKIVRRSGGSGREVRCPRKTHSVAKSRRQDGASTSLVYHRTVLDLSTNVQYVKGIGPRYAAMLLEKGITTVEDLLYYLPFRYEDRLNPRGIGELRPGEMASVIAEVRTSGLFRTRRMPIFEMTVGQGRDTLKCIWFNATYLQDKFRAGTTGGAVRQSGGGDRAATIGCRSCSRSSRFCTTRRKVAATAAKKIASGSRWRWGASSPSTKRRARDG